MNFYIIEPEVAGGLGENTVMDRTTHPPKVSKLHYKFDGWLGDVLLESIPCYIATKEVVQKLKIIHPTGVDCCNVEITSSEQFHDIQPNSKLPEFLWLKVFGVAGVDDFGAASDSRLVISERVLDVFKSYKLANAIIEPFSP